MASKLRPLCSGTSFTLSKRGDSIPLRVLSVGSASKPSKAKSKKFCGYRISADPGGLSRRRVERYLDPLCFRQWVFSAFAMLYFDPPEYLPLSTVSVKLRHAPLANSHFD